MQKINFEDGQLVKKGYVEIDGTQYSTEEAEYDGATPLSAHVLNKMQDNIEEAINNIDLTDYYNKSEVDTKLEAVEGNEVFIGNEEDAPSTTKIVIDEDEQGWEDEEDKTVVIEFTTASTAGGDSNLISYPSGFNRDNCYVSGVLFWREYPNNETVTTWYCLSGNYNVRLQANGIVVNMGAGTSEQYLNKPAKIFLKKYKEA